MTEITSGMNLSKKTIYMKIINFNGSNYLILFLKKGNLSLKETMKMQLILSLMTIIESNH